MLVAAVERAAAAPCEPLLTRIASRSLIQIKEPGRAFWTECPPLRAALPGMLAAYGVAEIWAPCQWDIEGVEHG